ncbi:MAG: ATP-binding protein [Chloroflexi bacterium]|nr:ATP-binding protein [Chloroflexota bacterium]
MPIYETDSAKEDRRAIESANERIAAMRPASNPRLAPVLKSVAPVAGVGASLIGLLVLVGWTLDIEILKTFHYSVVVMFPNAAIAFVLAGVSLWLLQSERTNEWKRGIGRVCALLVILIGLLTLIEYLLGWNLGIDQLIFRQSLLTVETAFPGRVPPNAALNFVLIGVALLLLDVQTPRGYRPAQFVILVEGMIGLLALVGYTYGRPALYGIGSYTAIALQGSVAFLLLCLGVLLARPDKGFVAALTSGGAGGVTIRRLLPFILIAPLLLDQLALAGQRAALYDPGFEAAVHTVLIMVAFAAVVSVTTGSLERIDARRSGAEAELRRLNEELELRVKERTAELERSNADLQQFAYVASHDLQEPLRMVASYVQLLARRYQGKLDSDADEFIAYAVDGATRMQVLINDLLAYSRVGTRGRPPAATEASAALQEAMSNLQFAIEESGAEITHDALPAVQADRPQLVQLFQNLIGNSIKFHGEETPRIHVSAEPKGSDWVFSVRDNGVGIAPEYFQRIFLLFQRLHGRAEYRGTGIGLAICKRIVERHGGRIWVESEVGRGSIFYFSLPRA